MLDRLSEYLAQRKGLLPLVGLVLVIANFVFQFVPGLNLLTAGNFLLHLGVVIAILGVMLAQAL